MATASVSYTFVNGDPNDGPQVSQNFTDLVTFLNNSVVHKDGSTTMTGALVLPASDPVSANQATRKSYVDNQSVRVFASTAARDAAITVPAAGMVCYIDAGDATEGIWTYNGVSWRQQNWNEPWGYLTQINGSAIGTVLRAGSASTSVTAVTGTYTHVANRRVRASAAFDISWTTKVGHAARLNIAGSSVVYQFAIDHDHVGFTLVGAHTASGSSTTYSATLDFAGTNSNVQLAGMTPFILLEDIGPAGAPV